MSCVGQMRCRSMWGRRQDVVQPCRDQDAAARCSVDGWVVGNMPCHGAPPDSGCSLPLGQDRKAIDLEDGSKFTEKGGVYMDTASGFRPLGLLVSLCGGGDMRQATSPA